MRGGAWGLCLWSVKNNNGRRRKGVVKPKTSLGADAGVRIEDWPTGQIRSTETIRALSFNDSDSGSSDCSCPGADDCM